MLGRLFSTVASTANTSPSGTRPSTSHALESDELHTRNLLYPDTSSASSVASSFHSSFSLAQSQTSASSCASSTSSAAAAAAVDHVDLEACRDVRVVIAQDAAASEHVKLVVYDSKPSALPSPSPSPPPPPPPPLPLDEGPLSPPLGALDSGNAAAPLGWTRRRNQHPAGMQHASALGGGGGGGGGCVPAAPDDELRVVTDCMFGVAPLSYKGPSTKVHILPALEERRSSVANTSVPSTGGSVRDDRHRATQQQQPQKEKEKRKAVLITRLFSVAAPPAVVDGGVVAGGARAVPQSGSGEHLLSTPTSSVGSTNGFPFPKAGSGGGGGGQPGCSGNTASTVPRMVKPSKSTMFAVGLIIYLPPATTSPFGTFPMRCCHHKPLLSYDADHPHHHEYCCPTPPSFDDDYHPHHHRSLPAGGLKPGCGLDDLHAAAAASDGRMDLITKHWDVITRALSDLQRVAQARILENLTSARLMSPQPGCSVHSSKHPSSRPELRRMALMRDDVVRSEVERLRWRVVTGIGMPRVVVGQGRWDLWQEEAKWANHRFGGRNMNFFFLTLLTAFLGHHTEWLDVLGPDAYKRRHMQQIEARGSPEDSAIPRRTVITTTDRIAARRLIYLLSAFLPAKAHQSLESLSTPSRASSVHYLSQSPPNFLAAGGNSSAPASNCGSLRRKARKKPSKLNMAVSSETEPDDAVDAAAFAGWTIPTSTSLPSSLVLPLPPAPASLCGQETTGAALATLPSSATCVASAPAAARGIARPGSSGSAASINLMSTLKRSGTANTSMDSVGWGSFLSFWSNPKSRSSSATSESSLQPDEDAAQQPRRVSASVSKGLDDDEPLYSNYILDDESSQGPLQPFSPFLAGSLPAMEQLSVDDVDGAINVPLDLSSINFASPLSSPPSSWAMPRLHSSLGLGRSLIPPPPPAVGPDDDQSCNVAGWVEDERFHPDFILQAVKPYAEIEADINRAMRSEPTPASTGRTPWSENGSSSTAGDGNWTTVSETLIADTKCLQIKRLRLRRRTKKAPQSMVTPLQGQLRGYLAVSLDEEEEEVIDEEILVDVDDTLASAVERVIDECEGVRCKTAILGALQHVVGEVVNGGPGARWGGNYLTEGVGRWICGVEETG